VDGSRTDWVFAGLGASGFVDVTAPNYAYRLSGLGGIAVDGGATYYGGGMVADVPEDARGRYTIGFSGPLNFSETYMSDPSTGVFWLAATIPGVIDIVLGKCCHSIGAGTTECTDGVTAGECEELPGPRSFLGGETCSGDIDADCGDITGACCDRDAFGGECRDGVLRRDCDCTPCDWRPNERCADFTCAHAAIPTVSHWGLVIMTLLLLTGAKVAFGPRRVAAQTMPG